MKTSLVLLILLGLRLNLVAQECASLMTPVSLEQRVSESVQIIEGKIISSQSLWNTSRSNIYTVHTIDIYKKLNNSFGNTIKIVTMGGQVGDEIQVTSSAAALGSGVEGLFFLTRFRESLGTSETLYELVGAAQGVIKYDPFSSKASDLFNTYTSIEDDVYSRIETASRSRLQYIKERPSIDPQERASLASPIIYSFSPLTATAGTQTVLTITGNDFGADMGTVSFTNANDGGASFVSAIDSQVLSWSNDFIQVEIPYLAGTGSIQITHSDGSIHTTTVPLTITYNHQSVTSGGISYPAVLQDDDGNGGFTFQYHTEFNSSSAKPYFEEAYSLWNCESNINFVFGDTTSTDESIDDGINIVRFDNGAELSTGVLGQVTTRFVSICGTTNRARVKELDITWNDNTNWYYGSGVPSSSEYDFKSVALHELGHAHQLGHVIDSEVIMHYAIASGDSNYALNQNDIDGAVYTMGLFTETMGCSITPMSELLSCCEVMSITTQPQDISVAEGTGSVAITVAGQNYDTLQWQESDDNGASWNTITNGTNYSGATTATLTLSNMPASADSFQYRVVLGNECGESLNSNSATLTILTYTTIPDANFESALDALGYDDISGDGQVPTHLIEDITSLNVSNSNIANLTGIEDFTALEELNVNTNSLTSIDISNNTNLTYFNCRYNSISAIDLSANTLLELLVVRDNTLTSLDISNNLALIEIYTQDNSLTALDVSANLNLDLIAIARNPISSLDLSTNINLTGLYATGCTLTEIDFSNNPNITVMGLEENNLESCNLQNGNNTVVTTLNITDNPNLECILVDDATYSTANWTNIDAQTFFSEIDCRYTKIPDSNFETALEALGYDDISDDGQVPTALIENLLILDVSNESIANLNGIEDFNKLEDLSVIGNNLNIIDVSNNLALEFLDCSDNNLATLSVSGNSSLYTLYCSSNNISTIDVSNNNDLRYLDISGNPMTTIDVHQNVLLRELRADNSSLLELDLSNIPEMRAVYISNSVIESLNLKNDFNGEMDNVVLQNNPNLTCVKVDDVAYSTTNWTDVDASISFSETDYCNYTAIPDANFEAVLNALGYDDISDDGQVPTALIDTVTILDVSGQNISDLTGITGFTLLEGLNCSNNNITTIDITNNNALIGIEISNNPLTAIDLSQNLNLYNFEAEYTELTSLDFYGNPFLESLRITNSTIETIDLRNGFNQNINQIVLTDNPSLTCISVDDYTYSVTNWTAIDAQTNFSETDYCAYTSIPDTNFEAALDALGYDDISNDGQVPTDLINSITHLDLDYQNIADFTGIEDFTSLTHIEAGWNSMTSIDLSQNLLLEEARFNNCNLNNINVSGLTTIEKLQVNENQIETIDISTNTNLRELIVSDNLLQNLDVTNNPLLEDFYGGQNLFTTVDFSNNSSLVEIELQDSPNLTSLNLSQNGNLNYVDLSNTGLTDLNIQNGNNTNISGSDFYADDNPNLTCIRVDNVIYSTTNWTDIDAGTTFSETYCQYTAIPDANFEAVLEILGYDDISNDGQVPTDLIKVVTGLDVANDTISDLTGIEDFEMLEVLDVSDNNLISIDITNNVKLSALDISNNPITAVDVSQNIELDEFFAENTALSSLDLSSNTDVVDVYITNTPIDYLNLKNGTNQNIDELVLTNNPNLTCILVDDATYSSTNWTVIDAGTTFSETYCQYTAIPDIQFETALELLGYDDISGDGQVPTALIADIISLDMSTSGIADLTGINDFTSLEILDISDNGFDGLDLSGNTTIKELYCNSTVENSLNVSNMTSLQILHCYESAFTTINLANCTALEELQVYRNSLISLDVSTNTSLKKLYCYENEMESINLEGAVALEELYAYRSDITNLDISNNPALKIVHCYEGSLEAINTNGLTELEELYIYRNELSSIDVSSNTALTSLHCYNQPLETLNTVGTVSLQELFAYSNSLSGHLDLSSNVNLEVINIFNNQLNAVNLQNGNNNTIIQLEARLNPLLACIQVDDEAYATTNWTTIDNYTSFSETPCSIDFTVALKVYLQGASLTPNTGEESLMRDDIRDSGYLPTISPYADAAMTYPSVFDTTGDDAIVDWVWIEFRDAGDYSFIMHSQSALLQRDGDIVDTSGVNPITVSLEDDTYYVSVHHRNHLGAMTSNPITLDSINTTSIDFTSDVTAVLEGNLALTLLDNGLYAIYAGDANGDHQILNTDITETLQIAGGSVGYHTGDVDMNGFILNTDIALIIQPNAGKIQQFD